MRKRQSFHHAGLMAAEPSIAIFADGTAAGARRYHRGPVR
jgi:hypothetical protein